MRPYWNRIRIAALVIFALAGPPARAQDASTKWTRSEQFEETNFTTTIGPNIRIHINAPPGTNGHFARATRLIIYALPNGNTLEQTLGSQMKPGLDWHYDIQHVAAQVRLLRTLEPDERVVLVCFEAPGLSWPSFRKQPNANAIIAKLVGKVRKDFGTDSAKVLLTGHSGGGGFVFSVIEANEEIPAYIDRIAFLDANYNFDAATHGKKLETWLKGNDQRRLIVIAYDDREIALNGKKVVGPTGGTYRATGRMHDALGKVFPLTDTIKPPFKETSGLDGRIRFFVHPNPENKILHTVLVGEMNGLVHVATLGTPNEEKWGKFGGPRAYTKWVQAKPTASTSTASPAGKPPNGQTEKAGATSVQSASARPRVAARPMDRRLAAKLQPKFPPRREDAMSGSQFIKSLEGLSLEKREAAILREITAGNIPEYLRLFKTVPIAGTMKKGGQDVSTSIEVMPDYLSVGSDDDFLRIPMTPQTAQQIADRFGCIMPTRKLVDAIDGFADLRLEPHPMTHDREALATFLEHNAIIQKQWGKKPLDLLVTGIKKDIVLTPRIFEKPQRLAIYGWRQLDGKPIQPLTIVHWNRYVDYSHGARLVYDGVEVDGKMLKISDLLADAGRCGLVSDEGPMTPPRYPPK